MRVWRSLIIAIMPMVLLAFLLPSSVALADEEVVTFHDYNLEMLIRVEIRKYVGDIYQAWCTFFYCEYSG